MQTGLTDTPPRDCKPALQHKGCQYNNLHTISPLCGCAHLYQESLLCIGDISYILSLIRTDNLFYRFLNSFKEVLAVFGVDVI